MFEDGAAVPPNITQPFKGIGVLLFRFCINEVLHSWKLLGRTEKLVMFGTPAKRRLQVDSFGKQTSPAMVSHQVIDRFIVGQKTRGMFAGVNDHQRPPWW